MWGNGDKGGGGLGGHALGVVYTGTAPDTAGVTLVKGAAGGDNVNGNVGDGAQGVTADVTAIQ